MSQRARCCSGNCNQSCLSGVFLRPEIKWMRDLTVKARRVPLYPHVHTYIRSTYTNTFKAKPLQRMGKWNVRWPKTVANYNKIQKLRWDGWLLKENEKKRLASMKTHVQLEKKVPWIVKRDRFHGSWNLDSIEWDGKRANEGERRKKKVERVFTDAKSRNGSEGQRALTIHYKYGIFVYR